MQEVVIANLVSLIEHRRDQKSKLELPQAVQKLVVEETYDDDFVNGVLEA